MATPYALVAVDETGSTQDDARELFDETPVLVVARRQRTGRGRRGATWDTAPRAVAASLAVRLGWAPDLWPRLSLMAGLAALDCLPTGLQLKWPNDVVREDEKLAGILTEATDGVVVVGIGLNLWWPDGPQGFGAVFGGDPGPDVPLSIAECWARSLLTAIGRGPGDWGRDEYRRRCLTLGRSIRWQPGGTGIARDVDTDGALVVETQAGSTRLAAGRVWEIRGTDSAP